VGAIAGIGLAAAHAVEEPAADGHPFVRILFVTVAFVVIEMAAVVGSFWALRRFLGIALPASGRSEASETE
jgi:hypothetical protein